MREVLSLAFSLGLILFTSPLLASSLSHFHSQVQSESVALGPVDSSYQARLKENQILFVNGVAGDGRALQEYAGLLISDFAQSPWDFLQYTPSAANTIEMNADLIDAQIRWLNSHRAFKPLILWGHSMGGLEVLLTILKHPDLFSKNLVDQVIVMQAPISGTPFAEMFKSVRTSSATFPGWKTFFEGPIEWFTRLAVVRSFQSAMLNGLQSLAQEEAHGALARAIHNLSQEQINEVSKHVTFVTVRQEDCDVKPWMSVKLFELADRLFPYIVDREPYRNFKNAKDYIDSFGPSDDVIPLRSQSLERFGHILGPLPGSHLHWITSEYSSLSLATSADIRGFIRALLKNALDQKALSPRRLPKF